MDNINGSQPILGIMNQFEQNIHSVLATNSQNYENSNPSLLMQYHNSYDLNTNNLSELSMATMTNYDYTSYSTIPGNTSNAYSQMRKTYENSAYGQASFNGHGSDVNSFNYNSVSVSPATMQLNHMKSNQENAYGIPINHQTCQRKNANKRAYTAQSEDICKRVLKTKGEFTNGTNNANLKTNCSMNSDDSSELNNLDDLSDTKDEDSDYDSDDEDINSNQGQLSLKNLKSHQQSIMDFDNSQQHKNIKSHINKKILSNTENLTCFLISYIFYWENSLNFII